MEPQLMIIDKCTRRCSGDVGHGRPDPLDPQEPINLAKTIAKLNLKYVVITSMTEMIYETVKLPCRMH